MVPPLRPKDPPFDALELLAVDDIPLLLLVDARVIEHQRLNDVQNGLGAHVRLEEVRNQIQRMYIVSQPLLQRHSLDGPFVVDRDYGVSLDPRIKGKEHRPIMVYGGVESSVRALLQIVIEVDQALVEVLCIVNFPSEQETFCHLWQLNKLVDELGEDLLVALENLVTAIELVLGQLLKPCSLIIVVIMYIPAISNRASDLKVGLDIGTGSQERPLAT
ncbi:hypothetical protein OJ253_2152 [Cryptosporidium canis]|uniref:Uncharacterized protein n=1 Tax=Cryptosporidium canis TaxID=195482 RepID=A0A9D5DFL2_9CRYT|nr:hypothetical protein OJ253_2152 [Cryptosporidium canis]